MDDPISKKEILEFIKSERDALESLVTGLDKEQQLRPGTQTGWSVKDVLAHITVWEQRLARWLAESLRGEVPERPAPGMTWDNLDKLNRQSYDENKEKLFEAVRSEFQLAHQAAMNVIAMLGEGDLFDGNRFAWRKGDPMWHMIAANTWWHYKEHREQIEKELAKS